MQTRDQVEAGTILERPAEEVWSLIRDFNNYPDYIRAVEDSVIEDDLTGTTVGAVRRFRLDEVWTRQRLVALSDLQRSFSYESTEAMRVPDDGVERELTSYQGTVRLYPTTVDGDCYVSWAAAYTCPAPDAEFWSAGWAQAVPQWLADLRARFVAR